jgi:hypothetical protein
VDEAVVVTVDELLMVLLDPSIILNPRNDRVPPMLKRRPTSLGFVVLDEVPELEPGACAPAGG